MLKSKKTVKTVPHAGRFFVLSAIITPLQSISLFTGIIETTAKIQQKADTDLVIARPALFDDISIGSSVAVNGACLTIVSFDETSMTFNLVPETWSRTNLGDHKPGDTVNLERSLKADGRFEGHVVQGHVEGTAIISDLAEDESGGVILTLEVPDPLMPFVVPKGGIAVDGISLTVVSAQGNGCTIALIPHTLALTNLKDRQPGDRVNIETDVLGRYLLNFLSKRS